MERRLLRAIMNPAMIVAWLLGITLVLTPGVVSWTAGWWHVKFASVLAMTWFHMHLAGQRKVFERGDEFWIRIEASFVFHQSTVSDQAMISIWTLRSDSVTGMRDTKA
jgi:hypothetical protein